jgi:hypothetical protein
VTSTIGLDKMVLVSRWLVGTWQIA